MHWVLLTAGDVPVWLNLAAVSTVSFEPGLSGQPQALCLSHSGRSIIAVAGADVATLRGHLAALGSRAAAGLVSYEDPFGDDVDDGHEPGDLDPRDFE